MGVTPQPADTAAALVFILGFPRSGTTLLGQILAAAPGTVLLEEKPLLAGAAAAFIDAPDGLARLAAASEDALRPYRDDFWQRARAHGGDLGGDPAGRAVIEQTAFNTLNLPLIARLFPRAKIVFAIRDPRDVVLSCFRRQFAATPLTLEFATLEGAARLYDRTMRYAELCRERFALTFLDARYEDVVGDFDGTTKRLCDALGLTWSPALRDFHLASQGRTLGTRSAGQIRRGLNADSLAVWRRYGPRLADIEPILAPWIARFGYPAE